MTNTETLNGKVQRFPKKHGISYSFKIIRNYWDKAKQMGTNKHIKTVLYIPSKQDINDLGFRNFAWAQINKELTNLYLQQIISIEDIEKAKRNFAKVLPRVIKPRPSSKAIAPIKPDPMAKHKAFISGKK
jgi:hypothetical protein